MDDPLRRMWAICSVPWKLDLPDTLGSRSGAFLSLASPSTANSDIDDSIDAHLLGSMKSLAEFLPTNCTDEEDSTGTVSIGGLGFV